MQTLGWGGVQSLQAPHSRALPQEIPPSGRSSCPTELETGPSIFLGAVLRTQTTVRAQTFAFPSWLLISEGGAVLAERGDPPLAWATGSRGLKRCQERPRGPPLSPREPLGESARNKQAQEPPSVLVICVVSWLRGRNSQLRRMKLELRPVLPSGPQGSNPKQNQLSWPFLPGGAPQRSKKVIKLVNSMGLGAIS